eukprot:g556.t1
MPESKSGSDNSGSESETDSLPESKTTSRTTATGWGAETQSNSVTLSNANSDDESDGGSDSKKQEKVKPRKRRSRFRKPSIRNKSNDESSEEEPIMLIPTLEEEGEEEVDQMPIVAPAPKILTLNIKTIQELDSDIKYSLPTASEGGIDLSALTQILAPQSSLKEDDKEWKFENLLQDVAQDINKELEAARLVSKAVEEEEE